MADALDKVLRERIDNIFVWPIVVPNFLSNFEIKTHMEWIDANESAFGQLTGVDGNDYWNGRSIFFRNVTDFYVRNMMLNRQIEIVDMIHKVVSIALNVKDRLYTEYLGYARWPIDYELRPHADSEYDDYRPHQFEYRNFAAITYLNSDYEGGDLYLPNYSMKISPRPGMLVVFPGTNKYLHGVTKVTNGVRHTITSFMTYDVNKQVCV